MPPPLGELHTVLSADVQLSVAVPPFPIEDGVAIRLTVGLAEVFDGLVVADSVGVDPSADPPPHAAKPVINSTVNITRGKALEVFAMLFNMIVFLINKVRVGGFNLSYHASNVSSVMTLRLNVTSFGI